MRNSIRTRLTIYFIGVAIVPLLLVGIVLTVQSINVQREQAIASEKEVTRRVSTKVQAFMERLENQLRTVVKGVRGQAPGDRETLLSELPAFPSIFQDIAILNASGKEITRISRLEVVTPADYADRSQSEEFTSLRNATSESITYFGQIQVDQVTGEPSMIMAVPMYNRQSGQVDGVVAAKIRFKEIWDYVASIQESSSEIIYIIDARSNRVIAHLNPSVVLAQTRFILPGTDGIANGLTSVNSVIATNKISFNQLDFYVVAEKPVSVALALAIQTAIVTASLLVAALAVATILGILASRRIVQPIRMLAGIAQIITVGTEGFDPSTLKEVAEGRDELGQLARVFQKMSHEVKVREESLKLQVMELRIEIDETKKSQQVAEIVETDYFRALQEKARDLRKKTRPTEGESTPKTT